jgi:hypothetical protein
MSNWTPTARAALEEYLDASHLNAAATGGDADEVVADLRRHVEEEIVALNLSVVTEKDVRRVIERLGGVPIETHKPSDGPGLRDRFWKGFSFSALFLFGLLLPLGTLIFELISHQCAAAFFDPIPTWFHVVLVVLVPVVNAIAFVFPHMTAVNAKRLWIANGLAFGVAAVYSMMFLPMAPFAVIGIFFVGIGFLPLSPILAMFCVLSLRRRIRRLVEANGRASRRVWWSSAAATALILGIFALPGPLTRHWIEAAKAESREESEAAVRMLRVWGSEEVILKECYGRGNRLWEELFSSPRPNQEHARNVFYRVTGKPFNSMAPPLSKYQASGRALFDEFEWDSGLGGEEVAGRVRGLSLSQSRFDGICQPEEGWAYVEWTMEFRNQHERSQREARAQIQLPPGGVVSRLTLWVKGEEREAAFAGRSDVRAAYQKVAVQQRRDPVLVTASGPDRVLMQCFPIEPNGGKMKVRIGITIPLVIDEPGRRGFRMPEFFERNFRIPPAFEHSVWIESNREAKFGALKLSSGRGGSGKQGLFGQVSDDSLSASNAVLWFEASAISNAVEVADTRSGEARIIKQIVERESGKIPERIAVVLDGSNGMNGNYPGIARALRGLPASPEFSVFYAGERPDGVYPGAWHDRESALRQIDRLKGVGGQDNVPALLEAWEWAAARTNGVVLWFHASQPVVLSGVESLKQRLQWQFGGNAPTIFDIPMAPGANRITEQLSTSVALKSLPRFSGLGEDLERLFGHWSDRNFNYRFVRTSTMSPEAKSDVGGGTGPTTHIARLWAAQRIQELVRARQTEEAIKLAGFYQLVTPISGAVVLETRQQFEQAGLTPVDSSTVPAVPEPSTWVLMATGAALLLLRTGRWRRWLGKRKVRIEEASR